MKFLMKILAVGVFFAQSCVAMDTISVFRNQTSPSMQHMRTAQVQFAVIPAPVKCDVKRNSKKNFAVIPAPVKCDVRRNSKKNLVITRNKSAEELKAVHELQETVFNGINGKIFAQYLRLTRKYCEGYRGGLFASAFFWQIYRNIFNRLREQYQGLQKDPTLQISLGDIILIDMIRELSEGPNLLISKEEQNNMINSNITYVCCLGIEKIREILAE